MASIPLTTSVDAQQFPTLEWMQSSICIEGLNGVIKIALSYNYIVLFHCLKVWLGV